ncbi:MAG: type VII toxin-antitoxin system HepT family RNase toxin [Candidatus Longimicrobiales bacterium M2_2A_002]
MVDPQKARSLLALYRRYRGYLEQLAERTDDELGADFVAMGGVQHYLLLLIETMLDLGSHVISSEGYAPPGNYADIFRVLRDEGILPARLADRLMAMARFRNVLVHLYADVDEERVLRVLRESLDDPDAFVTIVRQRFAAELEG